MTEDDAQSWLIEALDVSRETLERLDVFRRMVIAENERQNLVSAGSIGQFWVRHIADSAQLSVFGSRGGAEARRAPSASPLPFRGGAGGGEPGKDSLYAQLPTPTPPLKGRGFNWLDLGTGAGLPGIVIAILQDTPITMVESRRLRVEFLESVKAELGLSHATILCSKLESLKPTPFAVISARAFAPLHRLLPLAHSFSTAETVWLLPKGRKAREEIASVEPDWSGMFHVEQSLTDPESAIVVAQGISPRRGQRKSR